MSFDGQNKYVEIGTNNSVCLVPDIGKSFVLLIRAASNAGIVKTNCSLILIKRLLNVSFEGKICGTHFFL